MSVTMHRDGARPRADDRRGRRHGGRVVLATFEGAALQPAAARLAAEAAADMRSALLVVDAVGVRPGRRGAGRAVAPTPRALAAGLAAVALHAEELGVEVESVRAASLAPRRALLAVVADRRPALVVLGTDPTALGRFRTPTRREHRRLVDELGAQASCLLWTAQDPLASAARRGNRSSARVKRWEARRAIAARSLTKPPRSAGARIATNGNAA